MTEHSKSPSSKVESGEQKDRTMGGMIAEENSDSGPSRYSSAGQAERRQIQAEVVNRYRYRVLRVVRRHVRSPKHWQDAEQEGTIGLLIALEKFDPARGVPFEVFAEQWIRNEIQRWMDVGVHWRPRARKEAERTPEHANSQSRKNWHEIEDSLNSDFDPSTKFGSPLLAQQLFQQLEREPVFELVSQAELKSRLACFLDTLTETDRDLLLRETRNRFCSTSSPRYQALVERARAFVRGPDGEVDVSRSGKKD